MDSDALLTAHNSGPWEVLPNFRNPAASQSHDSQFLSQTALARATGLFCYIFEGICRNEDIMRFFYNGLKKTVFGRDQALEM
jgi:hypothetical protein